MKQLFTALILILFYTGAFGQRVDTINNQIHLWQTQCADNELNIENVQTTNTVRRYHFRVEQQRENANGNFDTYNYWDTPHQLLETINLGKLPVGNYRITRYNWFGDGSHTISNPILLTVINCIPQTEIQSINFCTTEELQECKDRIWEVEQIVHKREEQIFNCQQEGQIKDERIAELLLIIEEIQKGGNQLVEPERKISIYPNPTYDHINLTGLKPTDLVSVFDSDGKEQVSKVEAWKASRLNLRLGTNFVLIESEDGSSLVKKVVKVNR